MFFICGSNAITFLTALPTHIVLIIILASDPFPLYFVFPTFSVNRKAAMWIAFVGCNSYYPYHSQ